MKPREPRHKVLIRARMRIDGRWCDICIRDISSRGLLVQATPAPERGTYIEIFRGRHVIVGRVVWRKDRRFGVYAQGRLDIAALIEEPALSGADRREGSADRSVADRKSKPHRTVADELERSRRWSSAFEFGAILLCGAAAAIITFGAVSETLSRPLERIEATLAGQNEP